MAAGIVTEQAFDTGASTSSTSLACALTTNPTAGNTLVVLVATGSTAANAVTSVTDNNGNTYTLDSSFSGSSPDGLYIFRANNVNGGATTVTVNTVSTRYDVFIYE